MTDMLRKLNISDDADAFQIPISGLFADTHSGAASMHLADEFSRIDPRIFLKILLRWQMHITEYRRVAFLDLFDRISHAYPSQSIEEKMRTFEAVCNEGGQSCPSEIKLLLTRR